MKLRFNFDSFYSFKNCYKNVDELKNIMCGKSESAHFERTLVFTDFTR